MSAPDLSWRGYVFHVVEPGTTIHDEASGRTEVVDDMSVVFKGRCAWVTRKVLDHIEKAATLDQGGG